MKRELFVFAGQSNMMGASSLPPKAEPCVKNSFEYKCVKGEFKKAAHPAGQFVYIDDRAAHLPENVDEKGLSRVEKYHETCYFIQSCSNCIDLEKRLEKPSTEYSESNAMPGASMPPIFADDWEKLGHACSYLHLAKGSSNISLYFDDEMAAEYDRRIEKYNAAFGTSYGKIEITDMCRGAAKSFEKFSKSFFDAAKARFEGDDISEKIFVWNQGESNWQDSVAEYKCKLGVLWDRCKEIGFTRFFCVRMGYWGKLDNYKVMQAEEEFCRETENAYMLSRELSRMPLLANWGDDENEFYGNIPTGDYRLCRDVAHGFKNPHYNELGFVILSRDFAKNADRILYKNLPAELGDEPVAALRK